MSLKLATPQFLLCISAGEYPASLEARKSYLVIPDDLAGTKGFVRVIDESGEDYLYPRQLFATADVTGTTAVSQVAGKRRPATLGTGRKSRFQAKSIMTQGMRQVVGGLPGFDATTHEARRPPQAVGSSLATRRPRL